MFLTHNPAVLWPLHVRRTPTLLWMDVTPVQLDALADTYGHPVSGNRAARFVKHALVGRALRTAALCVAWSNWVRRSLVADYDVSEWRTLVVPPGIELSRWKMPQRDPFTGKGGLPRLLFVGGDFRRKGGDVLLEVFRARLRGRCVLDIVTRDPVPAEDGVRVHRRLSAGSPELVALYREASVFVLPTRGDCTPIAVIEAMAMGLPVVASKLAGIPELIEDGRSGHLVTPGEAGALGVALDSLVADDSKRRRMGARGRAIVEARHDARRTTERLFELAESITRQASSRAPTSLHAHDDRRASLAARGARCEDVLAWRKWPPHDEWRSDVGRRASVDEQRDAVHAGGGLHADEQRLLRARALGVQDE
jgi:glycosyltransferase involved in cell wall biosynthesis